MFYDEQRRECFGIVSQNVTTKEAKEMFKHALSRFLDNRAAESLGNYVKKRTIEDY